MRKIEAGLVSLAVALALSGTAGAGTASANAVGNGDFESDSLAPWRDAGSEGAQARLAVAQGDRRLELVPTRAGTARVEQVVALVANTEYRLSGVVESSDRIEGYLGVRGYDGRWSQEEVGGRPDGSRRYEVRFSTGAAPESVVVYAQAWKEQQGW